MPCCCAHVPQVREELDNLRGYLEGDLAISDQLYAELRQVEPQGLTPRQLILLRLHEHILPLKKDAERLRVEVAEVRQDPRQRSQHSAWGSAWGCARANTL